MCNYFNSRNLSGKLSLEILGVQRNKLLPSFVSRRLHERKLFESPLSRLAHPSRKTNPAQSFNPYFRSAC